MTLSGYFPEASYFATPSLSFFICTIGIMLGLNDIKHIKSLLACLVNGQCATSIGFLPGIQVRVPQQVLAGPIWCGPSHHLQPGLLACVGECIPQAFLCASSSLRLLWSCNSFHGAPVCDRVCPALKMLWWKCLCAKSPINIRSRPGCGVSRILPMLATIKGPGHRRVGNGGSLPMQWFSKAEVAFLFQLPFPWLTWLYKAHLAFLVSPELQKPDFKYKKNCQWQTIALPPLPYQPDLPSNTTQQHPLVVSRELLWPHTFTISSLPFNRNVLMHACIHSFNNFLLMHQALLILEIQIWTDMSLPSRSNNSVTT